jgi:hypothetical protein
MLVATACVLPIRCTREFLDKLSDILILKSTVTGFIQLSELLILVRSLNISSTERRGEVVLCIREIPGSNLGSETRYLD